MKPLCPKCGFYSDPGDAECMACGVELLKTELKELFQGSGRKTHLMIKKQVPIPKTRHSIDCFCRIILRTV